MRLLLPAWFRRFGENERVACRLIWRWKDIGKPHAEMPAIEVSTLQNLYHTLSVLEGKYAVAVARVERILAELEDLEDDVARQQGDQARRWLDESLSQLRETVGVVEELIVLQQSAQITW